MGDEAKLTGAACRAARALLRWTTADLATKAGVSASTVNNLERLDLIKDEPAARIIAAFKKARVEITNGDGTGARLKAR